jgi:hypothetical protein
MPSGAVLGIVVGCLLIALAAGVAVALEVRLMMTRRQFGSEYNQLATRLGHRRARAELIARKRRVAKLKIAPLPADRRSHYSAEWLGAQERFVDDPPRAVSKAGELVLSVAKERGYQADDREVLLMDLSVTHPRWLANYRRAEETAANSEDASTEDLRQALLWYRGMFRDLAGTGKAGGGGGGGDASVGKQGHPAAALRRLAPRIPQLAIRRPALRRVRAPRLRTPAQRTSTRRRPSLRLRRPALRLRRLHLTLPRLPRLRRPGSGDPSSE